MTNKESIEYLDRYVGNEHCNEKFQEACKKAISAMQEIEERQKGCAWDAYYAGYKYCPVCGKRIGDNRLTELSQNTNLKEFIKKVDVASLILNIPTAESIDDIAEHINDYIESGRYRRGVQ